MPPDTRMDTNASMGLRQENRQGRTYWVAQVSKGRLGEERVARIRNDLLTIPLGSIMVIDFTGVSHVGSSGIGGLIRLLQLARSCQVAIIITGLQPHIWALFLLTKMNRIFPIHKSISSWLDATPVAPLRLPSE